MRDLLSGRRRAACAGAVAMTERALAMTSLRSFVTQQDIANMALYLASPFGAGRISAPIRRIDSKNCSAVTFENCRPTA